MSGGSYNYAHNYVYEFADDLKASGFCYAAPVELRERFRAHVRKVADAMKAIDWNDSGDGDSDEEKLIREVLGI